MKNIKNLYKFFIVLVLSIPLFAENNLNTKYKVINDTQNPSQVLPSPKKPEGRPSVCLILSGGGAKGFSHIAVIEELEKQGIPIDMIIGASAGSIVGGLYAAGYTTSQMKDILFSLDWTQIFHDNTTHIYEKRLQNHSKANTPLALSFGERENKLSLQLGQGILSGQHVYQFFKELTLNIPSNVDFDTLPIPFRATTVNLISADVVLLSGGDLAEAIRASLSIPAFFKPFKIDGDYYIDGGTRDNTPIDVAKKMGYDIIIVSEISSQLTGNAESFSSNPATVLQQWITMDQSVQKRELYKKASLVIFPDFGKYSLFDFMKGQEIYDMSKKSMADYAPKIASLKDEITNKTKDKVIENHESAFPKNYSNNKPLYVSSFTVESQWHKDDYYINQLFPKIKDVPLTRKNYSAFVEEIYESGFFNTVVTRIEKEDNKTSMKIILEKKLRDKTVFLLGASYSGSISNESSMNFTLYSDFQLRNFIGKESVLSLKVSAITDYAAEIMYMKPLGSFAFFQFNAFAKNEELIVGSGFGDFGLPLVSSFISGLTTFSFGFAPSHTLTNKINFGVGAYDGTKTIFNTPKVASGFVGFDINLNTLNYDCLPSSGALLTLSGNYHIPITEFKDVKFIDIEEINCSGAIPLGDKFSILLGATAGFNFNQDLTKAIGLWNPLGFKMYDRQFFPNICSTLYLGTAKIAFEAGIKFTPWKTLTILGGQVHFGITGAIGDMWSSLEAITPFTPSWRTSLDLGVRLTKSFGFLFRFGVGNIGKQLEYSLPESTFYVYSTDVKPFLSFDLGNIRF